MQWYLSKHRLSSHLSISDSFIWLDFLVFALGRIWTGDIEGIWIPTTVQILPAPAVQMLSSPRKFVNNRILRHEDLCRKADINKVDKTTCLTVAMFKTKIQNQFTLKGPNQIKCDYTINSAIRPLQIWLTGWRFPWGGVFAMTLSIHAGDPLSKILLVSKSSLVSPACFRPNFVLKYILSNSCKIFLAKICLIGSLHNRICKGQAPYFCVWSLMVFVTL